MEADIKEAVVKIKAVNENRTVAAEQDLGSIKALVLSMKAQEEISWLQNLHTSTNHPLTISICENNF